MTQTEGAQEHADTRGCARADIEQKLAGIWADVLGIPAQQIRSGDHFFAIGGDSSLAVCVRERILEEFPIRLSIGDLFDAAKLGELAQVIAETIERGETCA